MVVRNTSFWKRKAIFPMRKLVGPTFSRIIEHHKSHGTSYKGTQSFLDKYCARYLILSLGSKKLRTKNFKIEATVPKKNFAHFFSCYPLWQTLSILLLGSTRYLGNYGPKYRIISLGPKRLFKTHIFLKKGNLFSEEVYLPCTFSNCRV